MVVFLFQIDFTRIVCSHEHYVALNLPSHHPSLDIHLGTGSSSLGGGTSSPTPSLRSNDSQSSFISHQLPSETKVRIKARFYPFALLLWPSFYFQTHWAELTTDFRKKHFLVGLVLSQLSNSFEKQSAEVQAKVRDILFKACLQLTWSFIFALYMRHMPSCDLS